MRILIYTHEFPPFLGGLATTSHKLARGISGAGHNVTVLAPNYPELVTGNSEGNEEFRVVRMCRFTRNHGPVSPFKELAGYFYLKKLLSEFKPDASIFITREAHIAGGLLINFPPKVIARVAGYEAYRYMLGKRFFKRILGRFMKRLYLNCQKVICPSEATRELLNKAGIPENNTQVIYNGVHPGFVLSKPSDEMINRLRNMHSIDNKEKIILTVSRLVPGKGQDKTIKALYRVNKVFGNFRYIIVGEGYYESELKHLVNHLGLASKVVFAGPVKHDQIIHYYDLCDIFVLANRMVGDNENIEGLPNVIFEACSRAKPVISGIPGGAKEIVSHDSTGYIIDGNDEGDLADKLLVLLSNPGLAQEFGIKGKENIDTNYTEDKMIEKYLALL